MQPKTTCLQEIADYIQGKVALVNLNNPDKTNKALYALRQWEDFEDNIELIIVNSLTRLQTSFHRDDSESCAGMTKLGAIVVSIGQIFTRTMNTQNNLSLKKQWNINAIFGGVMIEAMEQTGFVIVNREDPFSKPNSHRAPHMVHVTDRWAEVGDIVMPRVIQGFHGISFERPDNISSLYSNPKTKRPLIKHLHSWDKFHKMKNTIFLKGIDGMQQTGWRVNKEVLKAVINHDWKDPTVVIPKTGSKFSVDKAFKHLQDQSKKQAAGKPNDLTEAEETYERLSKYWAVKRSAQKERSRIIERKITIEKARSLSGFYEFYNYVEADYRGRLYYVESYLNFQSNDIAKGLLEFSQAKSVTPDGFHWMLIHAACSFNQSFSIDDLKKTTAFEQDYVSHLHEEQLEDIAVDKMSLKDRIIWAQSNYTLIKTVAKNKIIHPNAEKPIVFLAACIDIANCITAFERGHPYYSHLPIPVDGSNNGMQHAAAINKDAETGRMVGLSPSNIPADLYVKVGKRMTEEAPEFFRERMMPMKDIRKNISKRATMVRAYSAGAASISENMFSDAYKTNAVEEFNINARDCDFLAKIAIKAIDEVCPANTVIRNFLQNLVKFELGYYEWYDEAGENVDRAHKKLKLELRNHYTTRKALMKLEEDTSSVDALISNTHKRLQSHRYTLIEGNGNDVVSWVAPSGFVVDCSLFVRDEVKCDITISKQRYKIVGKLDSTRPDIQKHVSAIAANYIHSMDASHMSMTIRKWNEAGYEFFGGVHDSFATHCCDVDKLLQVIKETFIELYSTDTFYEDLVSNILSSTKGYEWEQPVIGSLDLTDVLQSDFFFA